MVDFILNNLSVITSIFTVIAALAGGFWAIFNYNESQKTSRATLVNTLYNAFYKSKRVRQAERIIKYQQDNQFKRLLQNRIIRRDIILTSFEIDTLLVVDELLNLIDHITYLKSANLIKSSEEFSMLYYWEYLLKTNDMVSLRQYIKSEHFIHLNHSISSDPLYYIHLGEGCSAFLKDLFPKFSDNVIYECNKTEITAVDVALSAEIDRRFLRDVRVIDARDVWCFCINDA